MRFEIPLTSTPQEFDIELSGKLYHIGLYWSDGDEGGWMLDISDTTTDQKLALGIPLTIGNNLLKQLEYLGINGELKVLPVRGNELPTIDNLGENVKVYFDTID